MAVSDVLNDLEELVASGMHVVFTNKTIIDEQDLVHLIDALRNELPNELKRASEIVNDRDNIIGRAQEEASRLKNDAAAYANTLVEETAIMQEAQARAAQIVNDALAQEKEIRERTMKDAVQLRDNAEQYANSVFDNLIGSVGSALNILEQAKKELQRSQQRGAGE